jgi:hypothetical protein
LDFNTALIQAGLGQYVKHTSSRPYGTRFLSSSKQRYAPVTLNAPRTAVWSKYAGHSSQRRYMVPCTLSGLHEYSQQVFNNLEAQLREYHSGGVGDLVKIFSGGTMDDNEIPKNFADGELWPLHGDIRRYVMTESPKNRY